MNLNSNDYKKIIKYYKIQPNKNISDKQLAEDLLSSKLCKCIKKVTNTNINEKGAIAICRKTIFKNRNIDFYNFKCKKSSKFVSKKGTTKKLRKYNKKIKFNKTRTRAMKSKPPTRKQIQ
jgi:hypothetical protein